MHHDRFLDQSRFLVVQSILSILRIHFEKILQDQEFLLPSGFSAADTSVGFSIYFSSAFVTHDEHPLVKAYFDRIMARQAFIKSMPDNQSVPMEWLRPKIGSLLNPNTGKSVED